MRSGKSLPYCPRSRQRIINIAAAMENISLRLKSFNDKSAAKNRASSWETFAPVNNKYVSNGLIEFHHASNIAWQGDTAGFRLEFAGIDRSSCSRTLCGFGLDVAGGRVDYLSTDRHFYPDLCRTTSVFRAASPHRSFREEE